MRQRDFLTPARSSRSYLLFATVFACLLIQPGAHAAGTAAPPTAPNQPPAATDWQKLGTAKADHIVVYKAQRRLELRRDGQVIRSYHIALGRNPVGPKVEQGDGKTPEGSYFIDRRNIASEYHLSLHLSYPETADIRRAAKLNVNPGGNVLIHGEPNILNHEGKSHLLKDWTAGCIALSNTDVDEIWRLVDDGITVDILP
jgi:murein L,D-transpeptidase YafK